MSHGTRDAIQGMVTDDARGCTYRPGQGLLHPTRVLFLHGRYVDMHHYAIVRKDWGNEQAYRQGRDF